MATDQEREVVRAVLYAMRSGCFFPVPTPKPATATTEELIRWGAMRHLHDTVAELTAGERPREGVAHMDWRIAFLAGFGAGYLACMFVMFFLIPRAYRRLVARARGSASPANRE